MKSMGFILCQNYFDFATKRVLHFKIWLLFYFLQRKIFKIPGKGFL